MRTASAGWAVFVVLLVASQPALGIGVRAGATSEVPFLLPNCSQLIDDGAAFCSSSGPAGLAVAGADQFFNGGVRAELYVDPGPQGISKASISFNQTLVNRGNQQEALLLRSILLPGHAFVGGEAGASFFVGMLLTIGGGVVERIASQSFMIGDANGNTTWQNSTSPALNSSWAGARWAGVPSNWPQDGPVASDVTLPFSVLDFNFNQLIAPGEEFIISYVLVVGAAPTANSQFVEAVLANIGDPLNLAQTPLIQYDQTLFAPVPEPAGLLLVGVCVAGLWGRRRCRTGRRLRSF